MDIKKIENILKEKVKSINSISGGSIADSAAILLDSGKELFVKNYGNKNNIILNEVNGIKELVKPAAIKVPEVVGFDEHILILEYIHQGTPQKDFFEKFGRQFANMHRFVGAKFGFYEDNFIGSNKQINTVEFSNWIDFYFNNRLLYQFKLAENNGYVDEELSTLFMAIEKNFNKILENSDEEPTLLHGDLWGGNFIIDTEGNACIIDPAVYYGNREADLAMTKLFGGFTSQFYSSYNEEYPLSEGYEYREDIYKLYHVLNHLNLFGRSYLGQAKALMYKYTK